MDLPLAAGEPSPPDRSRRTLRFARNHSGIRPMAHLQVPQQPGPTRARFEFAARAHRERIHSEVSDKPGARRCQEKMNIGLTFFHRGLFSGRLLVAEDHAVGLRAFFPAIFHVQNQIVLQNVVGLRVSKLVRSAIDCLGRPFQLRKRPDGGFIQFDQQPSRPGFRSGQSERGAVFLVAEPAPHPQPFEDFRQRPGLGNLQLNFFSDFVLAVLAVS